MVTYGNGVVVDCDFIVVIITAGIHGPHRRFCNWHLSDRHLLSTLSQSRWRKSLLIAMTNSNDGDGVRHSSLPFYLKSLKLAGSFTISG